MKQLLTLLLATALAQQVPLMESPFIRVKDCDILLYWKKPASVHYTSYSVWA